MKFKQTALTLSLLTMLFTRLPAVEAAEQYDLIALALNLISKPSQLVSLAGALFADPKANTDSRGHPFVQALNSLLTEQPLEEKPGD